MYKILKTDGRAKRGEFHTPHGVIQTPVFMNVGTAAAIKGAVSTEDLEGIKCQVELSNTYHLHVRPGDKIIKQLGGLHKFMNWNKPILTDSGGFQVFSLAGLRKIKEEGVTFQSHIDGHKIFMGPEESMQIQSNLGSTIAMAFDECAPAKADRKYIQNSVDRTYRWLERCKKEMARLNSLPDTVNPEQMLFGIDQGGVFNDIRIDHAKRISELDLDGYAVGGLAVGETHEEIKVVGPSSGQFDPLDYISEKALKKLTLFCDAANKSTGSSHPSDEERWFDFICQTVDDRRTFDYDTLFKFLQDEEYWGKKESGFIGVIGCFAWSEENAEELASEYDNYVRILQYYKKTRLGE